MNDEKPINVEMLKNIPPCTIVYDVMFGKGFVIGVDVPSGYFWCRYDDADVRYNRVGKAVRIERQDYNGVDDTFEFDGIAPGRTVYFDAPAVIGESQPPFVASFKHGEYIFVEHKHTNNATRVKVREQYVDHVDAYPSEDSTWFTYHSDDYNFYRIG